MSNTSHPQHLPDPTKSGEDELRAILTRLDQGGYLGFGGVDQAFKEIQLLQTAHAEQAEARIDEFNQLQEHIRLHVCDGACIELLGTEMTEERHCEYWEGRRALLRESQPTTQLTRKKVI